MNFIFEVRTPYYLPQLLDRKCKQMQQSCVTNFDGIILDTFLHPPTWAEYQTAQDHHRTFSNYRSRMLLETYWAQSFVKYEKDSILLEDLDGITLKMLT